MAALFKTVKALKNVHGGQQAILMQLSRNMAGWNKDFKPDLFPDTEKKRLASAKKYNLTPEEYRPYADDGLGYGDYPKLEGGLGVEAKDPYYPYDFPEHRRNFNEPIHADIDYYGEDRYSQAERPRYSNQAYWVTFLGVMSGCFALYYWLEGMKMFRPVAAKQYPGEGRVHYTFETE